MAFERKERSTMPEQDPKVRAHNFDEVALGFDENKARAEASRCLNCKTAPCMKGCPVSVRIPEFLKAVKDGEYEKAGEFIKTTNSLPSVCGRVCPQEEQCEKVCIRGKMEGAVSIGSVERFVGDYMLNHEQPAVKAPSTGKRVAVVGSGPAGLTCASQLAAAGVDVTIYEAFHKAGGVLVYGIPEFRLPKQLVVKKEIENILKLGVKLQLNTVIGKTLTIDDLRAQYDAIFIGSGAGLPMFMNIPGENLNGVLSANEFLTRVNLMGAYKKDALTPVRKGKHVAVVGAGNVAMDAARTALRLGAESVAIIYRRGREEMPAREEEIKHAEQEGVRFELMTAPKEIIGENGFVKSLVALKTKLGEPDASGRRRPEIIEGSEFTLDVDTVIVALGTSPNPLIKSSYPALKTTKRGTLETDENLMTSVEGIYAGGDAVTGAATVILAMGAGRKAAKSILERLGLSEKES